MDVRYKAPLAELWYGFDWSEFLPEGVTISVSTWTVPTGLTKDDETSTTTVALVKVSGGTVPTDGSEYTEYEVRNDITMSDGEKDSRTILIRVKKR